MSALWIGLIVFGCAFGGVVVGALFRRRLPAHHLYHDSKEVMKIGAGVIATLTALVLGLLISSAKNSYDNANDSVTQSAADVMLLNRVLKQYGEKETQEVRSLLRRTVAAMIVRTWPEQKARLGGIEPLNSGAGLTTVHDALLKLVPRDDAQKSLQTHCLQSIVELRQRRVTAMQRSEAALPIPFLVVMVLWLTILFASLGLIAPANPTNLTVMFLCALSVAGAVFLLVEMSHPTEGLMKVSSAPLLKAFNILGK